MCMYGCACVYIRVCVGVGVWVRAVDFYGCVHKRIYVPACVCVCVC